jgi:hypothetical protein
MNRDRRAITRRRVSPPHIGREDVPMREPDDVVPWLIAEVRAWPATVEDRLVAVRIGVGLQQVRRARQM